MLTAPRYIELLADLLNREADSEIRARRVREANRALYKQVVADATDTEADLALARSAMLEMSRT